MKQYVLGILNVLLLNAPVRLGVTNNFAPCSLLLSKAFEMQTSYKKPVQRATALWVKPGPTWVLKAQAEFPQDSEI